MGPKNFDALKVAIMVPTGSRRYSRLEVCATQVGRALRAEDRMIVPLGGKGEEIRDFKFGISKGRKLLKQLMRFARGHSTLLKQGVSENGGQHAALPELDREVDGGSTNMALLRSLQRHFRASPIAGGLGPEKGTHLRTDWRAGNNET